MVGEDDVAALHARSPHNIAHVETPRGDDGRFEEAAEALRSWEAEGVLLRDSAPVLYAYEQRTRLEGDDGPRRVRRGYFARLRLSPFEDGEVLPHERTMAGPKAERLALLQATQTNVSPILVISSGDTDTASALLAEAAAREPAFAATDGRGDEHRLWVIDDPAEIARLVGAAAAAPVLIADGHHRYETALGHLEERDEEGRRWMLACLVPENDPGLDILPTHRLVPDVDLAGDFIERLEELYVVEPLASRVPDLADPLDRGAPERLWEQVQAEASQPGTFGLIGLPGGGLHLLRPRSPRGDRCATAGRLVRSVALAGRADPEPGDPRTAARHRRGGAEGWPRAVQRGRGARLGVGAGRREPPRLPRQSAAHRPGDRRRRLGRRAAAEGDVLLSEARHGHGAQPPRLTGPAAR